MKQALVWRFEFSNKSKKLFPLANTTEDSLKWESRFFWSKKETIVLNIIDEAMLDLSLYKHKERKDDYYLLTNDHLNIKRRRDELLYKPIINQSNYAIGFGKKINLDDLSKDSDPVIISTLRQIRKKAETDATVVSVKKEAYIFKFPTKPTVKLELAKLEVHNKFYFSLCVEGRSRELVETISKGLLGPAKTSDYVHFLKTITT